MYFLYAFHPTVSVGQFVILIKVKITNRHNNCYTQKNEC